MILLLLIILLTIIILNYLKKKPICYGYSAGEGGSSREGTAEHPNFYRQKPKD